MSEELIKMLKLCFDKEPEDIIAYLESQGIEISWGWERQLEIIMRHSFTVSKVYSADALQAILDELVKSVKEGKTFKDFKTGLLDNLSKQGFTHEKGSKWRLDTVYRTNLQSAYMAGRYEQMREVKDDFPYWQYIAVLDNRTRPAHSALHGKVIRSDDPFWLESYPPNGYNCRCRIRALSKEEVDARGLRVTTGRNTGFSPDKGFNANPASVWKPDLNKYSPKIRKSLSKTLRG